MASKVLKKQGEITPNQISIIYFAEGLLNFKSIIMPYFLILTLNTTCFC